MQSIEDGLEVEATDYRTEENLRQEYEADLRQEQESKTTSTKPTTQASTTPDDDKKKKRKFDRKAYTGGAEQTFESPEEKRKQTAFPIKKPGSKNFFRVCVDPESRIFGASVIEGKMSSFYLVDSSVISQSFDVAERIKSINLHLCQIQTGDYFVWPIPNDSGNWSQSARKVIEVAEKWVRIHANGFAQGYDIETVEASKYPVLAALVPSWLPSGAELLDDALEGAAITDLGDARIQEILRGLK